MSGKKASAPFEADGSRALGGNSAKRGAPAASEEAWHTQPLLRPVKLADQIYEKIVQEIASGVLTQGQKLPGEMDLCKSFEVSRPVLREALARLKADGLLIARQGSGNFVRLQPESDFLRFAPSGGIAEILRGFEFRIGVEGEAAFLAAKRRTDGDLSRLRSALTTLRDAVQTGEIGSDLDFKFHLAIANASQNNLFSSTIRKLRRTALSGMNISRNLSLRKSRERTSLVQEEHEAIYDSIARGNGTEARRLMRGHLTNARMRMLSRDND